MTQINNEKNIQENPFSSKVNEKEVSVGGDVENLSEASEIKATEIDQPGFDFNYRHYDVDMLENESLW